MNIVHNNWQQEKNIQYVLDWYEGQLSHSSLWDFQYIFHEYYR